MRRISDAAALAIAAAFAMTGRSARAAAECDGAAITWPVAGQAVSGRTAIYGSAAIDAFQFYKLEYAGAGAPETWSATSDVVRTAARHARLDRWSTDDVPNGTYRLKLTVVDTTAQERCRRIVENVVVANGRTSGDAVDNDAPTSGRSAAKPLAAFARDPAAPWPTSGAPRASVQSTDPITAAQATDEISAVQATNPITPDGVAAPTIVLRDGAPTAVPETAAAAGESPTATLVSRFGLPFAITFALVAALMAIAGVRALRASGGRDHGPQR